ncbi:type VII secretion target [Streptomyces yokosukanensis]|uniref:type VII secretion target n=1 Tax=Streptomyces yokosukanensis TaxID=67386 RepID=UPI00342EFBA5
MADRIKYDLDVIKGCSRTLGKLHNEFDRHGNPADGYEDELGHDGLKDAFDEFGTTWKKTRKKLSKELKKLADYTGAAAQKYEQVDHDLAKAITDATGKGKK